MARPWRIEYSGEHFERFVRKLPEYDQAVLVAAVEQVLAVEGIDICDGEWGKSLGQGLYEFRVRRPPSRFSGPIGGSAPRGDQRVLLRVFCTFYGKRVVLVLGGYNKRKDPSKRRQEREIRAARKELARWRDGQR